MAAPARVLGPPTLSPAEAAAGTGRRPRSLWSDARHTFLRHRLATGGAAVFFFLVLATLVGPLVYHVRITDIDFGAATTPPSPVHPFGTDDLGQDVLARVLWGGRISLAVGMAAMLIAITVGTFIGAVAGFFGGLIEGALMRLTDVFISIPQLPLLLLIIYLFRDALTQRFGTGVGVFVLLVGVIGGLNWMSTARLVRAGFLSIREKEFIQAARCIGVPAHQQIVRHILPNVLSPVIVAATLSVGSAIIAESTLSFLGFGFPPDVPTWGRMLYDAQNYLGLAPWMALFPGLAIFLAVLSINYVGEGLRDALDPRYLTK